MENNFELTSEIVWLNGIKISKYRSKKTNLSFIYADVEGPLVEGAFVLSTEAFDDDGCPHTLEHLIFLGSELYPFKGILDSLANRCLASGTNAWTATDHTAYTIQTAGSEGFLTMLPIYVDHILYPTLTDSGFHTEVHHITGEGEDAGVVYCEMQGRENSGISRLNLRFAQLMFPGKCGYSSETGGKMKNLRSLGVDKVRQYHTDFYRPDNLCLIISGKVNVNDIIASLVSVEERILSKPSLPPMEKPWKSPVPPLSTSVTETIEFPSEDEDTGYVCIGWRGCPWEDFNTTLSLNILWKYLTDTAVSIFQQVFVEIEEPYCSEVDVVIENYTVMVHGVVFDGVPTEKLDEIQKMVFVTLKSIVERGLDMQRMQDVIHKTILEDQNNAEEAPHEAVQHAVIGHILYGSSDPQLKDYLDDIARLKALKKKKADYWLGLIKKYLLDGTFVCVVAKPSAALGQTMMQEEESRVQAQRDQLGQAKLEELAKLLDDSTVHNNRPIPPHIISDVKVPNVEKIPFIPITTIRNGETVSHDGTPEALEAVLANLKLEAKSAPFFLEFDHVPSSFIQLRAVMDTSGLPDELRPLLELYLDIAYELPVQRNNKLVPHEDIVAELTRDTVTYSNSIGFGHSGNFRCGSFSQCLIFEMKFEIAKYEMAVKWLREILWQTQFTVDRLKVGVGRLLTDIPSYKRKGDHIARAAIHYTNFDAQKSNHSACIFLRQQTTLKSLSRRLKQGKNAGATAVVKEMEDLRSFLCDPSNLRIQVVCDLTKLKNASKPWLESFLPSSHQNQNFLQKTNRIPFASELQKGSAGTGLIIGTAAIESGFLVQTGKGPVSFEDADLPALMVATEYLTALEGPFWKQIRGLGLAYGSSLYSAVEDGFLYFTLYRSTNVSKAFEAARQIVGDFASKKETVDEVALQSARSTVLYEIVRREETIDSAAQQAFISLLRGVPSSYNRTLLQKVQKVTAEDVQRALEKYINVLFDPSKSNVAVVLNPSKLKEVEEHMATLTNTKLTEVRSLEEFFGASK